ncbi:MAG: undecaprenyl-diphosphate phosphatase [bacterium]|nr:undecaprenyl-diphosphate phosphatase [bacterium]
MGVLESLILGIIQGITEFLPVSSSGHLNLTQYILAEHASGLSEVPLLFDILLHVASLLAVFIFFRKKVFSLLQAVYQTERTEERKEILFIIISTIITVAMIPLTKPVVHFIKKEPRYLLFTFLFTAIILIIAHFLLKKGPKRETITLKDSIIMGFLQGLAVFPGISRSGSTIFGGLISGLKGEKVVEYSFMLALVIIPGAAIWEMIGGTFGAIEAPALIAGSISSFAASYFSLGFLVFLIKKTQLIPFAIYLIILCGVVLKFMWL